MELHKWKWLLLLSKHDSNFRLFCLRLDGGYVPLMLSYLCDDSISWRKSCDVCQNEVFFMVASVTVTSFGPLKNHYQITITNHCSVVLPFLLAAVDVDLRLRGGRVGTVIKGRSVECWMRPECGWQCLSGKQGQFILFCLCAGGWGQVQESKEAVAMSSLPHDRWNCMLMPFCLFRPSIDEPPNKMT